MTTEHEFVCWENLCCSIECIFSCEISAMCAPVCTHTRTKDVNNKFEFYGLCMVLLVDDLILINDGSSGDSSCLKLRTR